MSKEAASTGSCEETCLVVLVPHHLEEVQRCSVLFILHTAALFLDRLYSILLYDTMHLRVRTVCMCRDSRASWHTWSLRC